MSALLQLLFSSVLNCKKNRGTRTVSSFIHVNTHLWKVWNVLTNKINKTANFHVNRRCTGITTRADTPRNNTDDFCAVCNSLSQRTTTVTRARTDSIVQWTRTNVCCFIQGLGVAEKSCQRFSTFYPKIIIIIIISVFCGYFPLQNTYHRRTKLVHWRIAKCQGN